jgi:hypothetical protein
MTRSMSAVMDPKKVVATRFSLLPLPPTSAIIRVSTLMSILDEAVRTWLRLGRVGRSPQGP